MPEHFKDVENESLAYLMDKKPEEKILEYIETRIKDLQEDAQKVEYASTEHANIVSVIEELESLKYGIKEDFDL